MLKAQQALQALRPSHEPFLTHVHTIGLQLSLHQFAAPDASLYDRRQRWFDVPSCWTVQQLEQWLCQSFAIPFGTAALRLSSGLQLREEEMHISLQTLSEQRRMPFLTLALTLRLNGGKGGFGANLRSAGGRMQSKKPNEQNISACRDLSGRRLRTVNEATELASFLAKEGDRKKVLEKKAEQKLAESKRILENSGKEGTKRKFTDNQFWEDKEKLVDETRAAVAEALKASKHVASADPIAVAPSNKKLKSTTNVAEAKDKSQPKKIQPTGGLSSHWGGDEDGSSSEEE